MTPKRKMLDNPWDTRALLDRFSHLKHKGVIQSAKTATLANLMCGDKVTVHVQMDCDIIKDVKFTTIGCVICTVVADLLAEAVLENDYTTQDILDLDMGCFLEDIGMKLTAVKMKCANLSLRTLKEALDGKVKT